jgi:Fe-S-cluster containining protein
MDFYWRGPSMSITDIATAEAPFAEAKAAGRKSLESARAFGLSIREGCGGFMSNIRSTVTTCRRCGTCCRKGGPALHLEDKPLLTSGQIPLGHLYTIRRGERVHDNVAGTLIPAPSDIIKIKGTGSAWTCRYFCPDQAGCAIYPHRPLECRLLKCWDTIDLMQNYNRRRLTRRNLLSQVEGLWDLVTNHQQRCDYNRLYPLLKAPQPNRLLAESIRYDAVIRELVVAKARLDPDMLDVLFGRPLSLTLHRGTASGNPSGTSSIPHRPQPNR